MVIIDCEKHGRARALYPSNGEGAAVCGLCHREWVAEQLTAKPRASQDDPESQKAAISGMGSSANARQVGGSHYAGAYQHWDFVRELGLDYWQGCATKYVSRWRKKNGAEDLKKAIHYIQKRAESPALGSPDNIHWGAGSFHFHAIFRFAQANGLTLKEAEAIAYIVRGEWEPATETIRDIIATVQMTN